MPLPSVGDDTGLPRVVAAGSGELTREEADDLYPILANSPLYAKRNTLAFGDTTAKTLFTLPAGAILIGFIFNVMTAFNGSTSNVIDVGTAAAGNRFVNDKPCGTGATGISLAASADETVLTAETTVQGTYIPGGGTPSAGAATITALYIIP